MVSGVGLFPEVWRMATIGLNLTRLPSLWVNGGIDLSLWGTRRVVAVPDLAAARMYTFLVDNRWL